MEILPECRLMMDTIQKSLDEGKTFKRELMGLLVTIILMLLVQTGSFLYFWGRLNMQVEINTNRITELEIVLPRVPGGIRHGS